MEWRNSRRSVELTRSSHRSRSETAEMVVAARLATEAHGGVFPVRQPADRGSRRSPPAGGQQTKAYQLLQPKAGEKSGLSLHWCTWAVMLSASFIAASAQGWQIECVDAPRTIERGTERSAGLDSSGRPHIVYGGDHLYHAWLDGTSWQLEIADDSPGVGWYPSLVFDESGSPHVSYYDLSNRGLKYAFQRNGEWQRENVEVGDGTNWYGKGWYSSLALDSSGKPHIGYKDKDTDSVKYAYKTILGWHIETVDDTTESVVGISLQLDADDNPHIAYRDLELSQGRLLYAYKTDARWTAETVAEGYLARGPSLRIDSTGIPHISYSDGDLTYAFKDESGWHYESVDDTGYNSSLILDRNGHPHISYQHSPVDDEVRYAYRDETGWHIEITNAFGGSRYFTSLLLDEAGDPHIAVDESMDDIELTYHFRSSGAWQRHVVDTGSEAGRFTAIAVDTDGRPHVAYQKDCSNVRLRYAIRDPSGWQVETLINEGWSGYWNSIRIDSEGYPHISSEWNRLIHAYQYESGWSIDIVDDDQSFDTSIALDEEDRPHVSYWSPIGRELRYAYYGTSGWIIQVVDNHGEYPGIEYTSIEVSSTGDPRISYYSDEAGDLRYAERDASGWHIHTVDSYGTVGEYSSLAIDSQDYPHISYYDADNEDLKYAFMDASGWHFEMVDTEGEVGRHGFLVLDSYDHPHISYFDGANGDLKYATKGALGWQIQVVDAEGIVGMYSSIAVSTDGTIHISYYDYSNADLRVATTAAAIGMVLSGQVVAGQLHLSWSPEVDALQYWIYGAENLPFFPPGESFPYEYRIDEVLYGTTSWVSPYPLGDPANNWTYLVMAVDATDQEITRSNRVGEWDWEVGIP